MEILDVYEHYQRNKWPIQPLNLFGIRHNDRRGDLFVDFLGYFWNPEIDRPDHNTSRIFKGLSGRIGLGTTIPGRSALLSPSNERGTAVIAAGHHPLCYDLGLHKNRVNHPAFVQRSKMLIHRVNTRTGVVGDLMDFPLSRELAGLNIHRANLVMTNLFIGFHSAGCQVYAYERDLSRTLKAARYAREVLGFKDLFSYSIIRG